MTDAGLAILRRLAGGPADVEAISRAIHSCGRHTRAALRGLLVAGLVEAPDERRRWRITGLGLEELGSVGSDG